MRLLACLARAVLKNGLKALVDAVPFGAVVREIAADAWQAFRERPAAEAAKADDATPAEENLPAEIQDLAQAPASEVQQAIEQAVQQTAGAQPPSVQRALT